MWEPALTGVISCSDYNTKQTNKQKLQQDKQHAPTYIYMYTHSVVTWLSCGMFGESEHCYRLLWEISDGQLNMS